MLSNKAKELLATYENDRDVLNMSLDLKDLKQDEFSFTVEAGVEDGASIKVVPYENNTTSSYYNVLPLHYANIHIHNIIDQSLLKKVRDGIAKSTRISEHATNTMNKLGEILTSQDLELYVKMQRKRDRILELSTSAKLFNNMRIGIELVKGNKWIIKPVIAFQKDTMKTNKEQYTAYAFITLVNGIESIEVHKEPYGMFKASLLMANDIINIFKSIADGVEDMNIVSREEVVGLIDNYILSFSTGGVAGLVNTQPKFNKNKALEAFETLLLFKDNASFETYSLKIERSEDEVVDYDRERKDKKVGTVIGNGNIGEEEFKQAVKDQLVRYKFEPVRLMEIGEISREPIWIREAAKEMQRELEGLGAIVHPSVLMTLGEMSPEDLTKNNNNDNNITTNSGVDASIAMSQSNVVDNGNGTYTVDGMVLDANTAMNMGKVQPQPQVGNMNGMTIQQMQQLATIMTNGGVNVSPPVETVRSTPLGTVEII